MRLVLITHKFIKGEGQGRVNYEVAQQALRNGHHLILMATEIAPELRGHPNVTWVHIPITHLPSNLIRNQVFAWYSTRWLRRYRSASDVVHVNGAITWEPGDVNAAHFVHSAWLHSPVHTARIQRNLYGLYQWAFTVWSSFCERREFRAARRVVAVSERVCQELIGIGVSPERIRVVLNGVDLDEFHPGVVDRTALDLPVGVPLALFVGDIRTPRKNLDTVLRALAHVPGVHLAVVGTVDGSPYPHLAEELGVSTRVHFLGYRDDVAEVMRAADLFVFPSRYEACSLVLLEALASGLPVITAVTAGGAEVITPQCGSVLPDPNDAAALAAAMRDSMGDLERQRCMGQAARAVAEQHSWASMANAYLSLYQELALSDQK